MNLKGFKQFHFAVTKSCAFRVDIQILRIKMGYFYGKFIQILCLNIVLLGVSSANEGSIFHQVSRNTSHRTLISLDVECPLEECTYLIVSNATENQQRYIDQLSTQISNGKDVEKLLDHVNWRMFIYSCVDNSCDFSFSEYEIQDGCINSSCSFTDTIDHLFYFPLYCGDNMNCSTFLNSYLVTHWYIFLVLGLLSLVGNIVVIYDKIVSLRKFRNKDKEIQIYHTLVLNLSLADFLMGLYQTIISFEIRHKVNIGVYFSGYSLCNALAIINAVSSQVSITTLFIISFYRLVGVTKPFKRQHLKTVVTLITLTWIIWLVIAILPVIPLEPFKTSFTVGLSKDYKYEKNSFIEYPYFAYILQHYTIPSFITNATESTSVLQAVAQFPTQEVMEKFSIVLGWVDFETESWSTVGIYDYQYTCSPDLFLFSGDYYRDANNFKLTFVLYNLVVSVVILIFYSVITSKILKTDIFCLNSCNCWKLFREKCGNATAFHERSAFSSAENRRMFKRISFIVLTDIMCWIPLCIASLVIWNVPLNPETIQNLGDYLRYITPFQIILLTVVPFNSILNPYIYSSHMWRRVFKKIRKLFSAKEANRKTSSGDVATYRTRGKLSDGGISVCKTLPATSV